MREPWSTKLLAVCVLHHPRLIITVDALSSALCGSQGKNCHQTMTATTFRAQGVPEKKGKITKQQTSPMGGISTRQHQQYPVPPPPPCQPLVIMASLELKGLGCHCDTVACRLVPFGDFLVLVLFSTAFYCKFEQPSLETCGVSCR
jgi:hypothetical protein